MKDWILPLSHFQERLGEDDKRFFVGMAHGSMTVELYKPLGRDPQTPGDRERGEPE